MKMTVELNGLAVDCVIGDLPEERTREQRLVVDVAMEGDFSSAARSDDLSDTVDYAALAARIVAALRIAKCRLVERAAAVVAAECLADPRVARASVRVTKSGCVKGLDSASVRIEAGREEVAPRAAKGACKRRCDVAVVANGETPSGPALDVLLSADRVVACDGALARVRACGREPDFVVGDGDSILEADRAALGERFVRIAEQDDNDLAKAFRFACERFPQAKSVVVVGAGGGREDHLIGNVFRLPDFARKNSGVSMATNSGLFEVVLGRRAFKCEPGAAVSVFAPEHGTKATSTGLEWALDGVDLSQLPAGTLNRTVDGGFELSADGPLVVYMPWRQGEEA